MSSSPGRLALAIDPRQFAHANECTITRRVDPDAESITGTVVPNKGERRRDPQGLFIRLHDSLRPLPSMLFAAGSASCDGANADTSE